MPTPNPENSAPTRPAPVCPSWCESLHADPEVINHVRLIDAVHNKPVNGSVAIEVEQQANERETQIVISVFMQTTQRSMSAHLTPADTHRTYAALAEALRLAQSL